MAALGIQSMFFPTSYGGASIEWVKVTTSYYSINVWSYADRCKNAPRKGELSLANQEGIIKTHFNCVS